uniref:NADH-ubiquinone oxidoreductase chain 2 n=1 Tax=Gammarus pisinnus TaxID=1486748 RepID=A0A517LS62_9CRUS|nr:NADH dehydrogenase subunit 2 [Gammarus pisinnus]QDS78463.1 NADH dehydrogenase subunit 2 [Gammarus pisinnus]
MLYHPSSVLFFISLLSSLILTISANSWFLAWLGLEINLLSLVPLITKKNKYSTESALKYFLTQAFASIFIIAAASLNSQSKLSLFIICSALLLKCGAAPSHQWLPAVVEGVSWSLFALLSTLQKMAPLILSFFLLKTTMIHTILIFYSSTSALVGAWGGLTQVSLRKILAYSSISHLSWILASLTCGSWTWLMYFFIYSFVLISLLVLLTQFQMSTLNHITTQNKSYFSLVLAASILSLGGLPPFTGFLPKFMVITQLTLTDQTILLIPLMISTFFSLFFYTRLLVTSLMLSSAKPNSTLTVPNSSNNLLIINLMVLLLPTFYMLYL